MAANICMRSSFELFTLTSPGTSEIDLGGSFWKDEPESKYLCLDSPIERGFPVERDLFTVIGFKSFIAFIRALNLSNHEATKSGTIIVDETNQK
uniref:Ovule protein n=1 Tax=Caenorhabditis tropicalis TaxID=1561998 RepID=A0A1I7ULB5_9PELO